MSAAALLAEAAAAGVRLALAADGNVRATGPASPDLIAKLRAGKPELVELLRGYRCRHCGEPIGWPRPVGLVFGDGTAAHHACHERAETKRVRRLAGRNPAAGALAHGPEPTIRRERVS